MITLSNYLKNQKSCQSYKCSQKPSEARGEAFGLGYILVSISRDLFTLKNPLKSMTYKSRKNVNNV